MQDFEVCPVGTMELLLKLEEENKELEDTIEWLEELIACMEDYCDDLRSQLL